MPRRSNCGDRDGSSAQSVDGSGSCAGIFAATISRLPPVWLRFTLCMRPNTRWAVADCCAYDALAENVFARNTPDGDSSARTSGNTRTTNRSGWQTSGGTRAGAGSYGGARAGGARGGRRR